MKNLFWILFIGLALSSCGSSETDGTDEPVESGKFRISGTISGAEKETIYVDHIVAQTTELVNEALIDGDGNFTLEGEIDQFDLYQLRIGDQMIPLTIVPGDNIKIEASLDKFTSSPKISGTDWAPELSKYMSLFATFHDSRDDLFADSAGKSEAQLKVEFMDMRTEIDAFAKNLMKNDPGNPANGVLYAFATPALGYEIWEPKNLELLQGVTNAFEEKWPESPLTSSISMQTFQIDQGYREYAQYSSGNNPAPEISLPDRDGNLVKLSDLRGQYVLIDFWASWCGPCRRENPNVVKLYNKYKDKGFTILSVSLDKNKGKWLEAINKDGLTWPNHVSDLMEWKSPVVGLYGIQGIPHTVLVNKEGNMIGVGLRGETLEQKLNEIFSNE